MVTGLRGAGKRWNRGSVCTAANRGSTGLFEPFGFAAAAAGAAASPAGGFAFFFPMLACAGVSNTKPVQLACVSDTSQVANIQSHNRQFPDGCAMPCCGRGLTSRKRCATQTKAVLCHSRQPAKGRMGGKRHAHSQCIQVHLLVPEMLRSACTSRGAAKPHCSFWLHLRIIGEGFEGQVHTSAGSAARHLALHEPLESRSIRWTISAA